ncbi:MAG TPA: MFS transporter [Actinomycetes bacterium]|nr:MFS transporter [Actinomycetes bacterium]
MTATRPDGSWLARTAGGLPRPYWFVWAGTVVNRLGQFVEPFLALYLVQGRGVSVTETGTVLASLGLGALVSQPLGGALADRIGRRATLVAGMVGSAAGLAALGLARQLWLVGLAAFAYGVVVDLYRPAVGALVADLVEPPDRTRAYALLYWAVNLGVSVSGVVGGVLALHGWWVLFVLDALTCLVFAVLIVRGVPETLPERASGDSGGYGRALRDRLLLALVGITLAGAVVYLQAYVTLPLSMRASGLTSADYGVAYAVNPLVIVFLQPLTLRALVAAPRVRVFVSSIVLLGLGFGLTALANSLWQYAATVVVWTLGEIAFNAVAPTIVADIAPPEQRGRYNGMLGLAYGAGAFLGPLLGTRAFAVSERLLWFGCTAVCLVAAGAASALGPGLRRREREGLRAD